MALINCKECGHQVSNKADACPHCGAKPKRSSSLLKYIGIATALVVVLSIMARPNHEQTSAQPSASNPTQQEEPKESPVNFDLPLQTTRGTLVCPESAAFDNREGRGLQAAMKSRTAIFSRQEDAEKAGCQEWREGLPVKLSIEERQRAKKWQLNHNCGMLSFNDGFVFSCDLKNSIEAAAKKSSPNDVAEISLSWDASPTLTGTVKADFFENCCVNGEATKEKYIFLKLDKHINLAGPSADYSTLTDVESIQIGPRSSDFREGEHITLKCKQLWEGNTGHYALPVYCNEPEVVH